MDGGSRPKTAVIIMMLRYFKIIKVSFTIRLKLETKLSINLLSLICDNINFGSINNE